MAICRLIWWICMLQGWVISKEHMEHANHHPIKSDHYPMDGDHNKDFDHEAVLGSKKHDFSSMSADEVEVELSQMIELMDKDKDGFVNNEELKEWVIRSFESLDDEEAREKAKECDENMDGVISWEEHLKSTYDYLPDEIEDFDKDDNSEIKSLYDMIKLDNEKFNRADVNQDGVLDEEEYPSFLHPYSHDHMKDLELKEILLEYDKNKDGLISFEEFLAEGEDMPFDKESRFTDEELNFKNFDENEDGSLDEAEIAAWAIPSHLDTAKEEAEHLIEESDVDHDGRLSKQEILDQQDLWIGSSATEYAKVHDPGEL